MTGKGLAIGLASVILVVASIAASSVSAQDLIDERPHVVQPGDTWTALAWRYGVGEDLLRLANPHPNIQIQPAIGQVVTIPIPEQSEASGAVVNADDGGLLQLAAAAGASPWAISLINDLAHPYHPLLYRAVFVPGGTAPVRHLPAGVRSLEVSHMPALPGQALAIRGFGQSSVAFKARFAQNNMVVSQNGPHFVALTGTGAFFKPGQYPLEIAVAGQPLWVQPWLVASGQWTFEEITFTGQAATIDDQMIRQERTRLAAIWNQSTTSPNWSQDFTEPSQDYLGYSSLYGARRSYGGGPFDRYHEGLDFSAYGGSAVYAPAAGIVALAEELDVRGGAVIIDHGLGVFTGYYHLSEVLAQTGQTVVAGEINGRVGSTGRSSGNHLHWDLLVAGTWVDPAAWRENHLACWLLEGLGTPCPVP